MAKNYPSTASSSKDDWEAHDAMHTLMRAGEIIKDKKLLSRARKKAAEHAAKMQDVADHAAALAKRGLISDKQMVKLKSNKGQGGKVKRLAKTAPLAKGNEGDMGAGQTQRGIVTK
jgi:hypothetical protein